MPLGDFKQARGAAVAACHEHIDVEQENITYVAICYSGFLVPETCLDERISTRISDWAGDCCGPVN
ncbi:hypothetical protein ABIB82_006518 [Bradyrhizobium sp. i1.8.4]|uniref:hypothetical protein n=1 Tax=unclassified Bradyrhizobium TaxID=2631580 RepID=UPI003D1D7D2B